jgi:ABC-type glutathione transport system ATPase component
VDVHEQITSETNPATHEDFEPSHQAGQAGISIRNLHKTFQANGFSKTAVDGLSLDLFEGQITVCLFFRFTSCGVLT